MKTINTFRKIIFCIIVHIGLWIHPDINFKKRAWKYLADNSDQL